MGSSKSVVSKGSADSAIVGLLAAIGFSRACGLRGSVSTVLSPVRRWTHWATTTTVADQMIQSLRDLRVEPAARVLDQYGGARALVGSAAVPAVVSPVSAVVTPVFSPV
jgi:hypothetical protein